MMQQVLQFLKKMRAQVRGLDQAAANAQDGISMLQTAEGALNETHSILQRVRELADQSANGTNTADDRKAIQDEVKQLKEEIDRIGNTTEFNTQKLLNGNLKSAGGATVGADTTTGSVVAKLSAGITTADASIDTNKPATADFVSEKITIDGTEIEVNWQNLTSEEQAVLTSVGTDSASRNAAKDLIVSKINEAIDASGANVEHVSGYLDAGKLVLQSGSKGVDSKIDISAGAGVLQQVMGTDVPTNGTAIYNGTTVASGEKFDIKVGDIALQVTTSGAITSGTTSMSATATQLQTDIKAAVDAYNTLQGKSSGDEGFIEEIKVNATKDGRLEIVSQSGAVSLADLAGKTSVSDLGLSKAQTEASGNGGMTFQIGANKGQTISFGINDMRSTALGISGVDVSTQAGASNALESLDKAIKSVSSERSKLGAVQNRLEHTINNLNTSSENLTAAESRIRDVDMAKEMMNQTKNSILSQAAQAMLAQANQQPQGVLQLLR
ncbi:flagellin [Cytobacillus sp. FSL H8-0458]|uniref:flagellin n=1 Tax=Cytobacillus sp. FSL H8-0458 TaxID=2975346 RepID=UPI0030FB2A0D